MYMASESFGWCGRAKEKARRLGGLVWVDEWESLEERHHRQPCAAGAEVRHQRQPCARAAAEAVGMIESVARFAMTRATCRTFRPAVKRRFRRTERPETDRNVRRWTAFRELCRHAWEHP
jgi:hypothetical protein